MATLKWPQCRNVRDLGGLTTMDGRTVRHRTLVRSDNLDQLDREGIAALDDAGVSRIVDLRSTWECETYPSPFTDDSRWRNVPLTDPADEDASSLDLVEQYCILVDAYSTRIAEAIAAISDAPPGCVVVTCHAGKDRTGIIIALTLDLVGVQRQIIAADYATAPETTSSSSLPELAAPQPDTILGLLAHVRGRHSGTSEYLLRAGVSSSQIIALTDRLMTS